MSQSPPMVKDSISGADYFLLMVVAVVLLYTFPGLVTWLPGHMIG